MFGATVKLQCLGENGFSANVMYNSYFLNAKKLCHFIVCNYYMNTCTMNSIYLTKASSILPGD